MPRNLLMYYFFIILGIIVLDQFVKKIIIVNMNLGQSVPVIQDIFHITYIRNTGAAFSLMENMYWLLVLLPIVLALAAVVFLFIKRKTAHPLLMTSVAMIAGGGLGNLIDRVVYGYVVDFLDFRIFPIFNVADICVCVGCGLMILYVLFFDGKKDGKRDNLQSNN